MLNVHLFIVDPQVDFCDPKGALYVQGGEKDMERLATMVRRTKGKLNDIHVTLDSHRKVDISHPIWWKRVGDGARPSPFTILGVSGDKIVRLDPANNFAPTTEVYTTYKQALLPRSRDYLKALAAGGRYPHCIWPEHCLIGSPGHNVTPELYAALAEWEDSRFAYTRYVTKGSNMFTEHFSGIKAEVPDPEDPTTQINTDLIQTLEEADIIAIAGEALSHCVANTVRDIATCFSSPKYVEKLVLLTDATSNVKGAVDFTFMGDAFVKELTAKGMKLSTTTDFLA